MNQELRTTWCFLRALPWASNSSYQFSVYIVSWLGERETRQELGLHHQTLKTSHRPCSHLQTIQTAVVKGHHGHPCCQTQGQH